MNERYIGVFDSGLGGLTVVKAIRDLYPGENIVFFADNKNMPYGNKEKEEIIALAHQNIDFLSRHDLKAVVIACNTSDSVALDTVKEEYPLPIIGVIAPAVKEALRQSKNMIIGLLATPLTVKMGKYERLMKDIDPDSILYSVPCPDLAKLAEDGISVNDPEKTKIVLQYYIDPLIAKGIDTLILGCTHYEMFKEAIEELYPGLNVVSSSRCVLTELKELLRGTEKAEGRLICYTNAPAEDFKAKASYIMNDIEIMSV